MPRFVNHGRRVAVQRYALEPGQRISLTCGADQIDALPTSPDARGGPEGVLIYAVYVVPPEGWVLGPHPDGEIVIEVGTAERYHAPVTHLMAAYQRWALGKSHVLCDYGGVDVPVRQHADLWWRLPRGIPPGLRSILVDIAYIKTREACEA